MSSSNKQGRIFSCDLIRLFAMLCVFIFHFHIMKWGDDLQSAAALPFGRNVTFGQQGVGLFIILSGMMCAMSFEKLKAAKAEKSARQRITAFYQKRFLSIYPPFWTAFFILFCLYILPMGQGLSRRLVFSAVGFDGYLSLYGINTCYIIGEWYIGVIVSLYLLFPVLYELIHRYPLPSAIALAVAYTAGVLLYSGSRQPETLVSFRILDFSIGIYFWIYRDRLGGYTALAALGATLLLMLVPLPCSYMFPAALQGASVFIVLYELGNRFASLSSAAAERLRKLVSFTAGYSYMFFLIHHFVLMVVLKPYLVGLEGKKRYCLMLLVSFALTFVLSVMFQSMTEHLVAMFRKKR